MATSSGNSQESRSPAPLRDTRTQLFVGNLPYRVRWQDLKDLFRRAGTVLRADVSLGPDNRSRGYGNVVLATAEDAGRAIDMLNGYCWQTRVLEVRPDRFGASVDETGASLAIGATNGVFPPASNPYDEITAGHDVLGSGTAKTLFVGNVSPFNILSLSFTLPFHIQWQDLKDLFRAAGAVSRADVALGLDGRSRGFGTVSFVTEDGAERARRMFDG
ncbi:RNA-binding domain-containing protein [Rhizopogon vinicolor AM-OR11-026]|uniref:RNA-binding domain-containing protein n=1 Tax=Rhizopogon vinicolor AM-OR11-026 TaxID=1314800 RepID=A0A1B7MVN5_9AGAM|nr:RNA-binding domain-containing protein [Rhizopogon vinicolor AM-OR11-026]